MSRRLPLVLMTLALGTAACGSGGGGGGGTGGGGTGGAGGGIAGAVCPTQHDAATSDGLSVVVCDALYGEAPYVRPPADTPGASFVATDGHRLYVRGQPDRALSDAELALLHVDFGGTALQGQRYAYAIYRASFDQNGTLTSSSPAILIEDALFLGFLAGKTAEGVISRHKPDPQLSNFEYEQTPSLQIRIRLGAPQLRADQDGDVIHRFELPATVENLSTASVAKGGSCLPPLTAAGMENPLDAQASVALRFTRVPAMHAPGDNELVIDGTAPLNHMAQGWMLLPHHLLLPTATIHFPNVEFNGHGNPLSAPRLSLAIVDGGGGACTP